MAFKNLFCVSLVVFSFLTSLSIVYNHAAYVPQETICGSTVDPFYCKNVISNQNGSIYDYCRVSVLKSLSRFRKFWSLVYSYLQPSSSLSQSTIRALQDCQILAELNFEYLSNTHDTIDKASNVLATSQAEDVQTLLSAILTNQQTCLDGLQTTASDQRVKNDISSPLSDDMKLYSVSLALFTRAWMSEENNTNSWERNERHLSVQNGHLPLKMSNRALAIHHGGRKLFGVEDVEEIVNVSDIVVVSQNGSGNFTTINDAIAAARNNTAASDPQFNAITAQGRTDLNQNTGISIQNATKSC